tara:strand:+ start:57 stop:722 length:666 start_codon:yes stop_codon:yes gene_type:complete
MNKKGVMTLIMVFELLLIAIVIFMVVDKAKTYGESDTVTKINIAEDIKMMVNTLVSVPGNVVIEYPRGVEKFNLILDSSGVTVFKNNEPKQKRVSRHFILPTLYSAIGTITNVNKICLEKERKKIILRKCITGEVTNQIPKELGQPDQNGMYTYDDGIFVTELYYRYVDGSWQWSPDKLNWMLTTTITVSKGEWAGKKPATKNIEIIRYLEKHNPDPNLVS